MWRKSPGNHQLPHGKRGVGWEPNIDAGDPQGTCPEPLIYCLLIGGRGHSWEVNGSALTRFRRRNLAAEA